MVISSGPIRRISYPFAYVPDFVEGELLFSWISRLHHLAGLTDSRKTLSVLWGRGSVIPSADLPSRLRAFIERTNSWGPFSSVEAVAIRATLFPYYSRFYDPLRYGRALSAISLSTTGGVKALMGIVANGMGASPALKSCRVCDDASMMLHGCLVFFKVHQLPGVLVCPEHGVALSYEVQQSRQPHRQKLFVPGESERRKPVLTNRPLLQRIAVLSRDALDIASIPITKEVRVGRYLSKLASIGLMGRGRVDHVELALAVGREYDDFSGFPFRARLIQSQKQPLRWLRDILARPDRSIHPLCHLLLIGFLFKTVANFVSAPCALPPSDASRRIACGRNRVPTALQTSTSRKQIEDPSKSCRSLAADLGVSTATIVRRRRALGIAIAERRKKLTPSVTDEVKRRLAVGDPIRNTATSVGLSVPTVYRILSAHPDVQSARAELTRMRTVELHRRTWTEARAQNPSYGAKKVRAIAGAAFAWLYRHDREWLIFNSATQSRLAPRLATRVDWAARDVRLAAQVREYVSTAELLKRKERITSTSLLRAIGMEATFRYHTAKLPILAQAVKDLAESDLEFCARRERIARQMLEAQGHPDPPHWRVKRATGIRNRHQAGPVPL